MKKLFNHPIKKVLGFVLEVKEDEQTMHFYAGLIIFPLVGIIFLCLSRNTIVFGKCFLLMGVGAWLNRIVMYANSGKMPSCGSASNPKHVALSKNTRLRCLGDVIYLCGGYISIGDIFQIVGIGVCLYKLFTIW